MSRLLYAVTPDPKRPELIRDAYEIRTEAEAKAKRMHHRTGRPHFVVLVDLTGTEHVFSGLDTAELRTLYNHTKSK